MMDLRREDFRMAAQWYEDAAAYCLPQMILPTRFDHLGILLDASKGAVMSLVAKRREELVMVASDSLGN